MVALCLDANLETLRPLWYRGTHRLKGDLSRCFHEGSVRIGQVVVTLFGKSCPTKESINYSRGY